MTESVRTVDHVARGVASAFGVGLFLGTAPASAISGWWLVAGLALAAALAVLFALSTADKPARPVPAALGILGRISTGIGIAGTFGAYVVPDRAQVAAVTLVVLVAGVTLLAPPLPAAVYRVGALVVLVVLAVVAVACFAIQPEPLAIVPPPGAAGADEPLGLLPATALLFVCYAGPPTPDRRARLAVVGVVFVVCVAVAVALLHQLGGERLALSRVPLLDGLGAADASSLRGILAVGVTVACAFALHAALGEGRAVAPALGADRFAVGLATVLVALGALVVDPTDALVGAAVLLLGEAVVRLLAGRRDPA